MAIHLPGWCEEKNEAFQALKTHFHLSEGQRSGSQPRHRLMLPRPQVLETNGAHQQFSYIYNPPNQARISQGATKTGTIRKDEIVVEGVGFIKVAVDIAIIKAFLQQLVR